MKQTNLTAFAPTRKLALRLIFMCLLFAIFTLVTSAQQKTTKCTMNGKTYDNCRQLANGFCEVNGQTFAKCETQTSAKCAEGGPLIIKLNAATGYYDRYIGYTSFNENLKCRGINIGFFGAASDVTYGFYMDPNYLKWITGDFSKMAADFLGIQSTNLANLNVAEFKEVVDTSKLSVRNGIYVTYLSDPILIDSELVRREQAIVENGLVLLGNYRYGVVSDINARIKLSLDRFRYLSATMRAIGQVRDELRRTVPSAEYDYGNFYHRVAVGDILAAQHREKMPR